MWFAIKGTFWFSLVLVLLPIFDKETATKLQGAPQVEITDALSAASGAYEYVSALCTEKPEVCAKGSETFTALGYRAREGARIAYEFLDNRFRDDGNEKTASLATDTNEASALDQAMPSIDDDVMTGTVIPLPKKKPPHS
ncbi:hypothetical protein DEM27_02955 [Metarhizobium album]|uniref:DUF5330 domain-containing protein n=1 Tax=Metarhizobium album TaxID=2182425 RepID=A0A2U2DYM8_9HYPH|nr:DUF5330 domain-containing protein [Rhizobium album]PWE58411.1 hypothetical protein DEM27_02955 [Rhizobium album]